MNRKLRKLSIFKRENAQTMVEFALVFPFILFITYGIIEVGRMVYIYSAVTSAAREGARYGAAAGNLITPYYKDCNGITSAARRTAILTQITVTKTWYDKGPETAPLKDSSNHDYTCTNLPVTAIDLGYRIGVEVTGRFDPLIPFLGFIGRDIKAQNARTIIMNVPIATPVP